MAVAILGGHGAYLLKSGEIDMGLIDKLNTGLVKALKLGVNNAPKGPQILLANHLLNRLFSEQIEDGDMDFMKGKSLQIYVRDLDMSWCISFDGIQASAQPGAIDSDVRISAGVAEYLKLLSRAEDPDTLFFQRKLVIEGDTELALTVKNMLDGFDESTLPTPIQKILMIFKNIFPIVEGKRAFS